MGISTLDFQSNIRQVIIKGVSTIFRSDFESPEIHSNRLQIITSLKKKILKSIIPLFLACIFLISACTHVYVPKESKFEMEKIPSFSGKGSISLINGQDDTQSILFATNGGHKFYGDLNKWTDVAIAITERELIERGITITPAADKTLILSVTSVNVTTGGWGFRGYVDLHLKTGDGYETTFKGETPSALLNNAADGALARAIVAMLSDEIVISYLSK